MNLQNLPSIFSKSLFTVHITAFLLWVPSVPHIGKTLPYLTVPSESPVSCFKCLAEQETCKPPLHSEMPGSILIWSLWSYVRQKKTLTGNTEIFSENKNLLQNQTQRCHQGSRHQLCIWLCLLAGLLAFQLHQKYIYFFVLHGSNWAWRCWSLSSSLLIHL